MKKNGWIVCIHKYECVLWAYHCHKKILLALVSKRASEKSLSNLSCPQIEETFGFVPITGGGGVLGIVGAGIVGKF